MKATRCIRCTISIGYLDTKQERTMSTQKLKRIDLDFPHSWDELTGRQMEHVHLLKHRAVEKAQAGKDPEKVVNEYKLLVFLYLAGIKVRKRAYKKDDGTFIYIVRRKGWRHLFEEIPMESWQVAQWITDLLGFLDEPNTRLEAPYEYFRIGTKKWKAPDTQLTSLTFEQYIHAQQYLVAYWDTRQAAEEMKKDGGTRKAVKRLYKEAEQYRAMFLATLIVPPVRQTEHVDENGTYRVDRTAYVYHSSYGERNWKRFAGRRWRYVFEVMQQFLQSCLEEYRNKFPDLFTTHKGGNDKDFIVLEADKMNAIKKYGNFTNYQDIYNTNTFFIFGMLSNMCQEAKRIEEMNRRIKSNR